MDGQMDAKFSTLGQRILQAARAATAVHLQQVAESSVSTSRGQRVVIGGAGPQVVAKAGPFGPGAVTHYSTDGRLPGGGGRDGGVEAEIPRDAPSRAAWCSGSAPSWIAFAEGAD
jgi:hypothetical protein